MTTIPDFDYPEIVAAQHTRWPHTHTELTSWQQLGKHKHKKHSEAEKSYCTHGEENTVSPETKRGDRVQRANKQIN